MKKIAEGCMRKYEQVANENSVNAQYKIIAVDDESGVIDTLNVELKRQGYQFVGMTNPVEAIERIRNEHFDICLLDFMMMPLHGDQVVKEIRKFNKELYILLLTGHKDLAPPLETIKRLDIQGYCEKSDQQNQLLLLIESGIKSISQMNIIKEINHELQDTYKQLQNAYIGSIEALRLAVDAKDSYTRGHSDRVSEYSMLIGKKLGLPEKDMESLRIGALFHDIGKIGVPDVILLKPTELTDEEYSQIKVHPKVGAHILSTATIFSDIIPIVEFHHEKYDGKGYPSKLAGEKIPYLARIVAVADMYDAMTSERPYRNARSLETVKEEIKNNLNVQFDPQIGQTFLDILEGEYETIEKIQKKYYDSETKADLP
jgi:putative nucleotidyltransferase with HDIG domain